MNYEENLMVKIAWYYYMENMTQQKISDKLSISRIRVIKLLEKARQSGIIQFKMRADGTRHIAVENALISKYDLNDVLVVPSETENTNETIAKAAAMYVGDRVTPNCFINIGYGDTVSRTLNNLVSSTEVTINLVSLTGGVSFYLTNTNSNIHNANLFLLPSPLITSSEEMAKAMKQETSLKEIYDMTQLAAMTIVGIGGINDTATVISSGILSKNDFLLLGLQGAVGDLLSQFIDKDGNKVDNDLHDRLISTPLDSLRDFQNVIGVAAGDEKISAINAVLKGGYLNVLITDENTANKLLEIED
ncbi:MAG: sugar-binding protein [Caproiciproducens sp.]|nr:sugar-binding protein [Caproiciproducens sp.]